MCFWVHFVVWWYNSCATGHHKIFPLQLKMESGSVATKIELPAVRMVSAPQNEGLLSSLNGKTGRNPPISSPTVSLRGPHQHAPVFTEQFARLYLYTLTPNIDQPLFLWLFIGFMGQKRRKSLTEAAYEADWWKLHEALNQKNYTPSCWQYPRNSSL